MAMLIVVPPRQTNISLGARRKISCCEPSLNICLDEMAVVLCAIDCGACTARDVFMVYAVCGEQLGRLHWSSDATPLVPQR